MPRINLLPWRQRERAKRTRDMGLFAIAAALSALAVTLLVSLAVSHAIDNQRAHPLPDGFSLTSVKQTDKRLELKGVAQSSTRVSTFMRNLEASPWLGD